MDKNDHKNSTTGKKKIRKFYSPRTVRLQHAHFKKHFDLLFQGAQPETYSSCERTELIRKGPSVHEDKTSDNIGSNWLGLHNTGETRIFTWVITEISYLPHTFLTKVSTFHKLYTCIYFSM